MGLRMLSAPQTLMNVAPAHVQITSVLMALTHIHVFAMMAIRDSIVQLKSMSAGRIRV